MRKFLSLVCFSALSTVAIVAQTQYNATSYHQFNTNYGYMTIGTGPISYFTFGTPKDYFRFEKAVKIVGNLDLNDQKWIKIGGSDGLRFHYHSDYQSCYIDYDKNLFFRNGQISPLILQDNGNVVIGKATNYTPGSDVSQGYRLCVNGDILCESVVVEQDVPNSDYVFESDYNLRDLYEIEEFVKENKHLPEVPSAKEFKENGYKLAEMDDLLLRKVEELTLYLIEQNKKIEALENENENLKNSLNQVK